MNMTKRNNKERVGEKTIVIDGNGHFPKDVIIIESGEKKLYRLTKTKNRKYQLNK